MATNLTREDDGRWRWRIDVEDMEALMRDFFEVDAWDVVEAPSEGLHVHLVKAEASSVLDEDACARAESAARTTGRVHLHRVEGGHWLNADNPDALVALLAEWLPR
jgi:pimeloyl-ACP methyl ester carboxylesterase